MYQSPDFVQGMRRGAPEFGVASSAVYLQHKYRDSTTGEWADFTYEYTTSFDVLYVAAQGRNQLFVVGVLDGSMVIERWLAVYRMAGDHATRTSVRRSVIYSGSMPSDIHKMAADPDGRFLLFLHGSPRALSRFDTESEQFTVVSDQLGLPPLDLYDSLARRQHATQGRVWIVYNDVEDRRLLLTDSDNNGLFETWAEYTESQWDAAGYNTSVWVSDILRGS